MPIYTLECPLCTDTSEHIMGMDDVWASVKCPSCGAGMTRGSHRAYYADVPQIQGDTVAGGNNYHYYDEALDMQMHGKQHRADVMKERNLTEYVPDPDLKKHRDEARYIRERSRKGDPDAAAAISREHKTAEKKRSLQAAERSRKKISGADLADARKRAGIE